MAMIEEYSPSLKYQVAMRASLVKEIKEYKGPFPYIDGIVLSVTSNIIQIKLVHQKSFDGKGNYNLLKSVSIFFKHITEYSLYPLWFATIVGIMAAGFSFLLGANFVVDYLTNDSQVEAWITLVLLSVFFNGLILMCLGLIGEYIGRIYLHSPLSDNMWLTNSLMVIS